MGFLPGLGNKLWILIFSAHLLPPCLDAVLAPAWYCHSPKNIFCSLWGTWSHPASLSMPPRSPDAASFLSLAAVSSLGHTFSLGRATGLQSTVLPLVYSWGPWYGLFLMVGLAYWLRTWAAESDRHKILPLGPQECLHKSLDPSFLLYKMEIITISSHSSCCKV